MAAFLLHLRKKDIATNIPQLAPGGIIPVLEIYMLLPLSQTRVISRTGLDAGWPCSERLGRASPPQLGQHLSHACPRGRELSSSWQSNRNQLHLPKAAGWLQSMRERTTARLRTQGCASSNKGVPSLTANFHTKKVRKENKCRNSILEKWKHLLKDFLKAIPHLWKATLETQVHSSWQSLQVTPNYPAKQDDSAIAVRQSIHVMMESNSQKPYFSGSACGNPDKIDKLILAGDGV